MQNMFIYLMIRKQKYSNAFLENFLGCIREMGAAIWPIFILRLVLHKEIKWNQKWACKMAQREKRLLSKLSQPNLILGPIWKEKKNSIKSFNRCLHTKAHNATPPPNKIIQTTLKIYFKTNTIGDVFARLLTTFPAQFLVLYVNNTHKPLCEGLPQWQGNSLPFQGIPT